MSAEPVVLGLETSCDETSAAILRGERELLGHIILSQDEHEVYGGVVPEIAARAHLRVVDEVVDGALRQAGVDLADVDLFGVTAGPGLIGALLVGVSWAKAAAFALGRPLVGVHHMEAHLFAVSLEDPEAEPPFVALLVSGGHTLLLWVPEWGRYELLGATRDDAAGEAFDKVAKILGLGYPGGPEIQRVAADGDPAAHDFPRPMLATNQRPGDDDYYDFSFSGLKTAVRTRVLDLDRSGLLDGQTADIAASFQAAVVDVLVAKTLRAVEEKGCRRVLIGGGVAASRALRAAMADALGPDGSLHHPRLRLATDNGAMIARAALFRYGRGERAPLNLTARADLPFPGLVGR
ncbi:MAG: tRNA (adenosine(37)-N6)-threonylcarbamoyltransferase complex transferase subunit TsaD [Gemmatimonadota bacterium]|jgi:N6-L-threonylcarbamoyladenine synthase